MLAFSPNPVARVAMTQIPGRVLDGGSWRVVDPVSARNPTMADIAREVADRYGLTMTELRGRSHQYRISHPRHEAFYLTYNLGRYSHEQIGSFYDRDRSTVTSGIKAHKERNSHLAEKEATK